MAVLHIRARASLEHFSSRTHAGRTLTLFACFLLWFLALAVSRAQPNVLGGLTFEPVANGLEFPVAITHAGDGSNRLFITLQRGRVLIHNGTQLLPDPFLDIRPRVSCCSETIWTTDLSHEYVKINAEYRT
jgi:hypothetical protein